MEDVVTEKASSPPPIVSENQETHDAKSTESTENFQKFMYKLFEKNGVLNDLRAYLRGHIVGILRNARTGDPPACQKHFTQRLELPYQAMNMLLVEYLLRLEFSYSLSVFISEIPLANMVLDFAKSLMQENHNNAALRFKDEDIWSILNYLGVKCDSEHAAGILEMYKQEPQSPLLLCMLKSMPLYTPINLVSSQESLSSSIRSSDTVGCSRAHRSPACCKHLAFCKTCHGKVLRIKDKYKKKKITLAKNVKDPRMKPQNVESLMKNIDVVERSLIDEMFQQLKSVYEAEMQMAKTEEEERVKRALASHALQLKKKRIEMEETFKARELELAHNVQQKKRFLWGLARLLRDQHQQMARAMRDVQAETTRLSAKEDSLKSQLAEAEAVLRTRGAEMRRQISAELAILEKHVDAMKKERDTLNKERSELEHMKHLCDNASKINDIKTTKDDLRSHYDLLKNEFNILKKYLETTKIEPKCVIDRSTITEDDFTKIDVILNNGQDLDRSRSEDRVKAKQVVNDLKKMKNVNFSQSNLAEIYRDRSRSSPSRSTASSEGGDSRDAARDVTRHLLEENERLRAFARQQREHIDELSSHQARLQAELTAARLPLAPPAVCPRTAPATVHNTGFLQRLSSNANSDQVSGHGWRKGAGEEMSFFSNAQPRILAPGDTVPFIGVLRDRHNDNRRHLINQWRSLRRRGSPVSPLEKSRALAATSALRHVTRERANSAGPSVRFPTDEITNSNENQEVTLDHSYKLSCDNEQKPKSSEKSVKIHEENPKLVLKERLKSKDYLRVDHEPSPSAVIRDAKLRLRKLEIEAEAVERSYLDFRRRQDCRRADARNVHDDDGGTSRKDIDLKQERPSSYKADESHVQSTSRYNPPQDTAIEQIIEDFDEYQKKYDIGAIHFKNKNASSLKIRPIPKSSIYETQITKASQNFLETSMAEFRTYYHSERRNTNEDVENRLRMKSLDTESPRSPFISPRIEDQPIEHAKISPDTSDLPRPSLSPNVELIEKNVPNSPKNRENATNQENADEKRNQSPKTTRNCKGPRTELNRQSKHDKAKELEILKQNISKIYNLSEKTLLDNDDDCNKVDKNAKWELQKERKSIVEDTITEASRDGSETATKDTDDKNLIRIEVQSVSQVNDVKITESLTQDLILVVESSKIVEHSEMDFQDMLSTQMTILVSPNKSLDESDEFNTKPLDINGEKSINLSGDVLDSLYRANEKVSSNEMQLENSIDGLVPFLNVVEINEDVEYPEDFSAEADNINSLNDTDHDRSPISMAKTSEDENFWDS